MPLIEGIGDEVTHFFIGLIVVLIVSLAWWTTSISEHRHVQTVWLLDRRRHRANRRLTNHTHAVTITEGTATSSVQPENSPLVASTIPKPPEASTSTSPTTPDSSTSEDRSDDDDRNRIVQTMDADACVVRQRRLAFYDRNTETGTDSTESSRLNENYTVNDTVMAHNYPDAASSLETMTNNEGEFANAERPKESSDITIKLKYINDDLRLVNGKLQEPLGEFKKRHFQPELSSNKLVRLIFNGQVLQQDSKTLEGCGLFDNCVVHCLIHQRRHQGGEESSSDVRHDQSNVNNNRNTNQNNNNNNNNNNQGRDWDLGNFLFAIISFTLLSAWYFRYVYAHLYTVTATVGLILMTGVFTIVLFGFYFPDHEPIPQRMDSTPGTRT